MRRARPIPSTHNEEEVPWASFADALTGLLFVFILLALSFAHQLENATRKAEEKAQRDDRARVIARSLVEPPTADNRAYSVAACLSEVPSPTGDPGPETVREVRAVPTIDEARLSLYLYSNGQASIEWFKGGVANLLPGPCTVAQRLGACLERAFDHPEFAKVPKEFRLRVFVEGHTDFLSMKDTNQFPTNWELSGARAAAVVRAFMVHDDARPGLCNAPSEPARRLAARTAAGDLEVVSVGLADRRPAWRRLCDDTPSDPVCSCLTDHQGKAEDCAEALSAAEADLPPGLLPADQLIAWANRPEGADEDARRKLLRRVDLRFEVAPRSEANGRVSP